MDYNKLYASKLCTAKEAVKDVTSGDWVDYAGVQDIRLLWIRHWQRECRNWKM